MTERQNPESISPLDPHAFFGSLRHSADARATQKLHIEPVVFFTFKYLDDLMMGHAMHDAERHSQLESAPEVRLEKWNDLRKFCENHMTKNHTSHDNNMKDSLDRFAELLIDFLDSAHFPSQQIRRGLARFLAVHPDLHLAKSLNRAAKLNHSINTQGWTDLPEGAMDKQ